MVEEEGKEDTEGDKLVEGVGGCGCECECELRENRPKKLPLRRD